jgi:copper(I)-binding protein
MRKAVRTGSKVALVLFIGIPVACDRGPALAEQGGLRVESGYGYPAAGDVSAAYVRIRNRGGSEDTLAGVTSPQSHHVMLMTTTAGQMSGLATVTIPPGQSVTMAPGALHLMLEGVGPDLGVGDSLELVLQFSRAGEMRVTVPVVPYGEMPQ